jgi:hypothetical protein
MNKDEALKMAIEALEEAREQLVGLPALEKLIQDCKEALATNKESSLVQPAQPLDIEILNSLYDMAEERDGDAFDFDHIKFARAIEKAHRIGLNDD